LAGGLGVEALVDVPERRPAQVGQRADDPDDQQDQVMYASMLPVAEHSLFLSQIGGLSPAPLGRPRSYPNPARSDEASPTDPHRTGLTRLSHFVMAGPPILEAMGGHAHAHDPEHARRPGNTGGTRSAAHERRGRTGPGPAGRGSPRPA